jgi:cytochrome P450
VGFPRKAVTDFTLSNGVGIPSGTFVSVAFAMHFDPEHYEDPETFDGLRFLDSEKGESRLHNVMAHTTSTFVPFGHGRHACVRAASSADTCPAYD